MHVCSNYDKLYTVCAIFSSNTNRSLSKIRNQHFQNAGQSAYTKFRKSGLTALITSKRYDKISRLVDEEIQTALTESELTFLINFPFI